MVIILHMLYIQNEADIHKATCLHVVIYIVHVHFTSTCVIKKTNTETVTYMYCTCTDSTCTVHAQTVHVLQSCYYVQLQTEQ